MGMMKTEQQQENMREKKWIWKQSFEKSIFFKWYIHNINIIQPSSFFNY